MITVLGASGFIGSHMVKRLRESGMDHWTPARAEPLNNRRLGTVFYCIGLTADFRTRPFDTVEAHINKLLDVLRDTAFDQLVYLSSTRVYRRSLGPCSETSLLHVQPSDPEDLYDLSKAMGESLALSASNTKVVRLSNVYGPGLSSDNFLPAVITAAIRDKLIVLQQAPQSQKDYVSVHDVVELLLRIARSGRERIYNVASGHSVTHGEIVDVLRRLTGCTVEVASGAPVVIHPSISIRRSTDEFAYVPAHLLEQLPQLVSGYTTPSGGTQ
jgi:nucleoside-diphosphate-sugar epimerase